MKNKAIYFTSLIILLCFISCNSQRPVNYSKNYSYGFYNEGDIFFLLDYKVWQKGRSFWFIMPVEGRTKVYYRKIFLYKYDPETSQLDKLSILRENFRPAINVRYSKFIEDRNRIVFAYYAGFDENYDRLADIFIFDAKSGIFVDTGYDNPVSVNNPLYKNYFDDYISPYRDNPGIIGISRLKNEILEHLPDEKYGLPAKW